MGDRLYAVGQRLLKRPFEWWFPLSVTGREFVPEHGGVLLCSNHGSNWDPVILGICLSRPIRFMAKEELFRVPGLSSLIRALGAFPVRRGSADRHALRTAVALLKEEGQVVGLFPEGTRRRGKGRGRPFPGVGLVALWSRVPVIPAYIETDYRFRSPVRVRFGPPVDLSPWEGKRHTTKDYEEVAAAVMEAVYRLAGARAEPVSGG
ncbi:MAG: lysophospholipid acyltransferase family protein [Alicyclobacillaceae bacterium]|nr:lysophospholipid acyltransferase family protein [Alicyclobacillaceae bacterium]